MSFKNLLSILSSNSQWKTLDMA